MSGTMYCPLCKAEAFPKTSFGSVVSLDCGHVVRKDGESFNRTKRGGVKEPPVYIQPEPSRRSYTPAAKNVKPLPKVTSSAIPDPPRRTVSGTSNVAKEIVDLMGGKRK